MDIQTTQPPSTAPAQTATETSSAAITSDFETFLLLMTEQLKHQDPLDPMDSAEFSSQLAQFSTVEQQVQTNDLLKGLQDGFATLGLGELGGWIGMQARAEMPAEFNGNPVIVANAPEPRADRMELVVRDAQNRAIQRVPMPLGASEFVWTGEDAVGNTAPHGTYNLTVESYQGEDLLQAAPAQIYAEINEAQLQGDQVLLTMSGGQTIASNAILGLRNADTS